MFQAAGATNSTVAKQMPEGTQTLLNQLMILGPHMMSLITRRLRRIVHSSPLDMRLEDNSENSKRNKTTKVNPTEAEITSPGVQSEFDKSATSKEVNVIVGKHAEGHSSGNSLKVLDKFTYKFAILSQENILVTESKWNRKES